LTIGYYRTVDRVASIIVYLEKNGPASGSDIAKHLGISRQAVNRYVKKLVENGAIVKHGKTRGAFYALGASPVRKIGRTYPVPGLEEDRVFSELSLQLRLKKAVNNNTFDILHFAFTEMLNNVIDHSESPDCAVEIKLGPYDVSFVVRDFGIGLYLNVAAKFGLPDEAAAALEISKGKTTTMEERHTGQGIFFTSKIGDTATFSSHEIALIFDNARDDVFWKDNRRSIKGTEVTFVISRTSRRRISDVFAAYAPEEYDYAFEKTHIHVNLLKTEYISRSEAKRLLNRLDKFKEIVLDFKGVEQIGQGFADEVFRVFRNNHPDIAIKIVNLSPAVEAMVKHIAAGT